VHVTYRALTAFGLPTGRARAPIRGQAFRTCGCTCSTRSASRLPVGRDRRALRRRRRRWARGYLHQPELTAEALHRGIRSAGDGRAVQDGRSGAVAARRPGVEYLGPPMTSRSRSAGSDRAGRDRGAAGEAARAWARWVGWWAREGPAGRPPDSSRIFTTTGNGPPASPLTAQGAPAKHAIARACPPTLVPAGVRPARRDAAHPQRQARPQGACRRPEGGKRMAAPVLRGAAGRDRGAPGRRCGRGSSSRDRVGRHDNFFRARRPLATRGEPARRRDAPRRPAQRTCGALFNRARPLGRAPRGRGVSTEDREASRSRQI